MFHSPLLQEQKSPISPTIKFFSYIINIRSTYLLLSNNFEVVKDMDASNKKKRKQSYK